MLKNLNCPKVAKYYVPSWVKSLGNKFGKIVSFRLWHIKKQYHTFEDFMNLTSLLIKSSIVSDFLLQIFSRWDNMQPCTSFSSVKIAKLSAQACFPSEFCIDAFSWKAYGTKRFQIRLFAAVYPILLRTVTDRRVKCESQISGLCRISLKRRCSK